MVKKLVKFGLIVIVFLALAFFLFSFLPQTSESFDASTILIKLNIPYGGESTTSLELSNIYEGSLEFDVFFNGLENLAHVSPEKFSLESKENKKIDILFKDELNVPGTYLGELIIRTELSEKKIPVILGVEDKNNFFALSQSVVPGYESVYSGGKLGMEVKMFNLLDSEIHNVKLTYFIKNFNSEVVLFDEENLILKEGLEKTKIIEIPEDFSKGDYVLITTLEDEGAKTFASYLFSVEEEKRSIFSEDLMFFIVLLIFVFCIFGVFLYFIMARDDLVLRLKKQQDNEIKKNVEIINNFKTELKKIKDSQVKEKKIRNLNRVKKEIVRKIKLKHKIQKKQIKRLKKQGKESLVSKKVKAWEKEGYVLPRETRKSYKLNMDQQLKDWKKQGFNVDF